MASAMVVLVPVDSILTLPALCARCETMCHLYDGTDRLSVQQDYLVKVEIPDDAFGRPLYKVTREEDINIANGDSFVPQVPPPACAGALHTVDVAGSGTDNYRCRTTLHSFPGVTVPASTPVDNPTFVDIGGSVYEGQPKPLCDMKLVHLSDRKSIAPGFNLFTDVPLPGRFWGLTVDDLELLQQPASRRLMARSCPFPSTRSVFTITPTG